MRAIGGGMMDTRRVTVGSSRSSWIVMTMLIYLLAFQPTMSKAEAEAAIDSQPADDSSRASPEDNLPTVTTFSEWKHMTARFLYYRFNFTRTYLNTTANKTTRAAPPPPSPPPPRSRNLFSIYAYKAGQSESQQDGSDKMSQQQQPEPQVTTLHDWVHVTARFLYLRPNYTNSNYTNPYFKPCVIANKTTMCKTNRSLAADETAEGAAGSSDGDSQGHVGLGAWLRRALYFRFNYTRYGPSTGMNKTIITNNTRSLAEGTDADVGSEEGVGLAAWLRRALYFRFNYTNRYPTLNNTSNRTTSANRSLVASSAISPRSSKSLFSRLFYGHEEDESAEHWCPSE